MRRSPLPLYLIVLVGILGVFTAAAGGGLFGQQQPWFLQWQHQVFAGLCHQIPERSFWINGQPMAVCSRCLGIYGSFALGWLGLPLLARIKKGMKLSGKQLLIFAIVINVVDFIGNLLGLWQNTLISRTVAGGAMGLAAAALFAESFFHSNKIYTGTRHGKLTTTGL